MMTTKTNMKTPTPPKATAKRGRRAVTVKRAKDDDGAAVVLVSMLHGATTKMLPPTYDRLIADGFTNRFSLNSDGQGHSYVKAQRSRATGTIVTLARVIAGAGPGQIVRYADGDRTNLRDDNLLVTRGYAKRADASIQAAAPDKRHRAAATPDNPPLGDVPKKPRALPVSDLTAAQLASRQRAAVQAARRAVAGERG